MEAKKRHINLMAVVLGSLFCFLHACTFIEEDKWASVENESLSKEDGLGMMRAEGLDPQNKKQRDEFLLRWVKEKEFELYLKEIKSELYYDTKNQALRDNTNLYRYHIENEIIEQSLENNPPTEQEIIAYYRNNRTNFSEEIYLVKALYLKVALNKVIDTNIEELYLLKNGKDREEIKNFANLYATNFYFEENKWIVFDDLVREMPIDVNIKELIETKGKIISKDNQFAYYLNILSYNTKEALKPSAKERKQIEQRILAKKAKELRVEMSDSITQLIENKYEVKFYTK